MSIIHFQILKFIITEKNEKGNHFLVLLKEITRSDQYIFMENFHESNDETIHNIEDVATGKGIIVNDIDELFNSILK